MQNRAILALATRLWIGVAILLAVSFAELIIDWQGVAHCHAAMNFVVERIGLVTSAEGRETVEWVG